MLRIGDDWLLVTQQLVRGQFKGMLGQVVEATDTHVKVELHSKMKKITVGKNQACTVEPSLIVCCSHVLLYIARAALGLSRCWFFPP